MKTTLQKATAIGNKSVHVPKEVGEGIKQTCSGDEDHKEDEGSYGSDNRELIFVQWGYLNITTKRRWFEIPNKKQKKKTIFFLGGGWDASKNTNSACVRRGAPTHTLMGDHGACLHLTHGLVPVCVSLYVFIHGVHSSVRDENSTSHGWDGWMY